MDKVCIYCGEPATGVDHLLPRAWSGGLPRKNSQRSHIPTVPCCKSCNTILNDSFILGIAERRAYICERLKRRKDRLSQARCHRMAPGSSETAVTPEMKPESTPTLIGSHVEIYRGTYVRFTPRGPLEPLASLVSAEIIAKLLDGLQSV